MNVHFEIGNMSRLVLENRVEWIGRRRAQDKAPSRNLLLVVVMFSTVLGRLFIE
jgi:hypothetical protein